jgi:NitT/TauT family transport system substrate-binding protein
MHATKWLQALAVSGLAILSAVPAAHAQEKVRIGVNPVSSSLPLYVGLAQGFFKDEGLEMEQTQLIGAPPNVAALIGNQIDVASNLTTIDAANAYLKKPGFAVYIAINSQNRTYQMEQFVVRSGLDVKTLADLKGKKIMSAPGPANMTMARAVLRAVGLKDSDYTLDQLDIGQHINALTSGTFDAAYTLEPAGAVLRKTGAARTIEAGLIAKYVLGDPDANAWVAGTALNSEFIKTRPEVARKFAAAWAKSIDFIEKNPAEARKSLLKNTLTPPDVVDTVPIVKFVMTSKITDKDIADFQKFIDFCTSTNVLSDKVDVKQLLFRP